MGAPKGAIRNPKGRGHAKGKKTIEWEEFGRLLMEAGLPRMLEIVQRGDDADVLKIMLPMMEYFKPKLARTENNNHNDNQTTIFVTWEDATPIHTITATSSQSAKGLIGGSSL